VAARRLIAALALVFAAEAAPAQQAVATAPTQQAAKNYAEHCANCHGAERLGGTGPALLPENLERLRRPAAAEVIAKGRIATQMQGFGDKLDAAAVQELVEFIYARPAVAPRWELDEIRASHIVHPAGKPDSPRPVYKADPMKLFVVVETGDHHATILDGERFEPLTRFATRYALHGGPKFSPDGRFVYFGSRDGWVQKYDLWNLRMVAEVRAGLNTRNIATSSDGRFVAVANYLPHTLVILDSDLQPVKLMPVRDREGKASSRVSAVYDAAPRRSFVAALKDVREVWEISYDPKAPDIPAGLIHDFRFREGAFVPGFLNPRRTVLEDFLDDFFFTPDYSELLGASREGAKAQVVHLDVRRRIASIELPGMPHLGSGISWERDGRRLMATPNLREGLVTVVDVKDWKLVKQIPTRGPGFFLRSHENTPYAWVDAFSSKHKDTMQVIDKRTLEVVKELRPAPGRTTAHVEFSADGRHALVSVWEMDGELLVYDAASFELVKRLPMKKPSGKYNVHNKITRSDGTSH
jgi:mono/diheme cytochrome c family protein/DNA-binding beta-propeller fold protein YncE